LPPTKNHGSVGITQRRNPKRRLYLNLLALAEDQEHDLFYGFFFLVESEAAKRDEDIHWFKSLIIVRIRAR